MQEHEEEETIDVEASLVVGATSPTLAAIAVQVDAISPLLTPPRSRDELKAFRQQKFRASSSTVNNCSGTFASSRPSAEQLNPSTGMDQVDAKEPVTEKPADVEPAAKNLPAKVSATSELASLGDIGRELEARQAAMGAPLDSLSLVAMALQCWEREHPNGADPITSQRAWLEQLEGMANASEADEAAAEYTKSGFLRATPAGAMAAYLQLRLQLKGTLRGARHSLTSQLKRRSARDSSLPSTSAALKAIVPDEEEEELPPVAVPFTFASGPMGLKLKVESSGGVVDHVLVEGLTKGGTAHGMGVVIGAELVQIDDTPVGGLDEEHMPQLASVRPVTIWFAPPHLPMAV